MHIEPYLFFNGRCEEAIGLYKSAVGAEVLSLMRFRDSPESPPPGAVPAGYDDKVMHATLRIGQTNVLASDGPRPGPSGFHGFSLVLRLQSDDEAERIFAALAEGGPITMPLGPTFFASRYGMLSDRFGVGWMVIVAR